MTKAKVRRGRVCSLCAKALPHGEVHYVETVVVKITKRGEVFGDVYTCWDCHQARTP